jgi:hypothetical protein
MRLRYTVQKAYKDDEFKFYGCIHSSYNVEWTICGLEINERWTVRTNDFSEEITCKKCNKLVKNLPYP